MHTKYYAVRQSTKSVCNSRGLSSLLCHEQEAQGLYFVKGKSLFVLSRPALYKTLRLSCTGIHSNSLASGWESHTHTMKATLTHTVALSMRLVSEFTYI